MSTALKTTKLSKRYGRTWALQDCTLSLPAGTPIARGRDRRRGSQEEWCGRHPQ